VTDNALLLADVRQTLANNLAELTLVEITGGDLQVTFVAEKKIVSDAADSRDMIMLRSNGVNIADGNWHHIEIIR